MPRPDEAPRDTPPDRPRTPPAQTQDDPGELSRLLETLPERVGKWLERRVLPRQAERPPLLSLDGRPARPGAQPVGGGPLSNVRAAPGKPVDVRADGSSDLLGDTQRLLGAAGAFSAPLGRLGQILGLVGQKIGEARSLVEAFRKWKATVDGLRQSGKAGDVRAAAVGADLTKVERSDPIVSAARKRGTLGGDAPAMPVRDALPGGDDAALPEPPRAPLSEPMALPSAPPPTPPTPAGARAALTGPTRLDPPRRSGPSLSSAPSLPPGPPPEAGEPPSPSGVPSPPRRPAGPPTLGAAATPRQPTPLSSSFADWERRHPLGAEPATRAPKGPLGGMTGAAPPMGGTPARGGIGGMGPAMAGLSGGTGGPGGGKDRALLDVLAGLKEMLGKSKDGGKDGAEIEAMLAKAGVNLGGVASKASGALSAVAGQGRPQRKSSDDAEGMKWSRRAGAFAGEFAKALV